MGKLQIVDHPLVRYKITKMRDINTGHKEFRELMHEVTLIVGYEATKNIPLEKIEVQTPYCKTEGFAIKDKYAVVPILNSGMGMFAAMLTIIPTAKAGNVGVKKDEATGLVIKTYETLPEDCSKRSVFLLDPLLASGNTACAAIEVLKNKGIESICLISLVASPEGVGKLQTEHPDVSMCVAAYDVCLDKMGWIIPGIGNVSDRLYGSK